VCKDCGCEVVEGYSIDGVHVHADGTVHSHSHAQAAHEHPEEHAHPHPHGSDEGKRTVPVGEAILSKNDRLAERNRGYFLAKGLLVLNVLSSPGAGKTAFIQRTAVDLGSRLRAGVIVGDLETDNDAQRLRQSGLPAVQITTGTVCHLDAQMVETALQGWDLDAIDVLFLENVGNLVCPAGFDLGESQKIAVLSVAEGDEKPAKYPALFIRAAAVLINKVDLLPYVKFSIDRVREDCFKLNSRVKIFPLSCTTGEGFKEWMKYCEMVERKNVF
jgi:hydrogenase nickel incorporation protein HypB